MLEQIGYKKKIPFIISLALFMEALDGTIINTAIPSMARSLNVNPIDLKIALISYLLSLAVFIPISGWVADKFGVKKVFMNALAIFTLSSLWCGFTHNLVELVIGRILQGLGGSLMLPVGRLMLLRVFPRNEIVNVMNRVIMIAALGIMLGPVLGGFISYHFTWRWIFWINIPVGLFTLLLVKLWIEDDKPQAVPPLDKIGFILFGCGLSGLTYSFSAFSDTSQHEHLALPILIVSIILLSCYLWRSQKQPHPIVKTHLFNYRTFRISVLGNLLSRLGFGGVPFLLPLLLQVALGYNAQESGLLLAPLALGVLLIKFFTVRLLKIIGYKKLLMLNTMLVALSLWSFSLINIHTSIYFIALLTFLFGFLISLQYSGMNSLAYADMPQENLSAATSIMSTLQQISQSFGVASSAIFIRYFSSLFSSQVTLTTQVLHYAFLAMSVVTLLSILIFVRLKPQDGEQMIQR